MTDRMAARCPTMIDCEGSLAGGHDTTIPDVLICRMCGESMRCTDERTLPKHQRRDILADLARGDFD